MRIRSNRLSHSLRRPGIQQKFPDAAEGTQPAAEQQVLASETFIRGMPAASAQAAAAEPSRAGMWAVLLTLITSLIWGAGALVGFQTALGIQMGLGILLAIVGLASPALGLLAIGMLSALDSVAADLLLTGGLLRFNTLNYILLIVMALHVSFVLRLRDINSRALQIFIVIIALQLLYSENISRGVQDVLNIATTFGIVIYFARSLRDEQALYWLGVVNGVLAGLGTLLLMLQINSMPYTNPNNWSFFPLTALFSICISFPYARLFNKSRLLLILLAVVNFTWIFLSGSRGSLLIALLCVLYLFLSTRSISLSSIMVAMVILAGIWVSAQFVEQQSYTISRIRLLFDPNLSESERTSQRSALAQAGWMIFQENPFGIGTGSFREETAATNLFSRDKPAHSAWVKTLAENGIPGILMLSFFIASYFIIGLQKHQDGKLLFGLFLTIVFASAFVAKEFRGKSLWFLAASGIVLMHPREILGYLQQQAAKTGSSYRQTLREVRFGRRK